MKVAGKAFLAVLAASAPCATGRSLKRSLAAQWSDALDSLTGPTPVQRVITLLNEMKDQLIKEADEDADAQAKAACWCTTNEKAKTKAVAEADAKITELLMEIESRSARGGELSVQIQQLKKELAEKKQSLATATSIREKDAAAFHNDAKETVQAVTMLKNALQVLGKHAAGLLQITPAVQESLGSAIGWVALKHEELLEMSSETSALRGARTAMRGSSKKSRPVASLLTMAGASITKASATEITIFRALSGAASGARASPLPANFAARVLEEAAGAGTALVQQPTGAKSYSPQSGEILGILGQMKDEFEAHMTEAQQAEAKAVQDFQSLKAALESEITAGKTLLDEQEGEAASNSGALSMAKRTLEATRNTRAADVQFLQDLKLQCNDLEGDYKARVTARNDELQAVNEALVVLTDDESRDLFHKTMGTGSFLQLDLTEGASQRALRTRLSSVLLKAAADFRHSKQVPDEIDGVKVWRPSEETPHAQLAALAVQAQLDSFTQVKATIDNMVADLKVQQQQEVDHKATCTQELSNNEKQVYSKKQVLSDVQDKIGALQATIEKLGSDIEAARAEIARMQVEVKKAGELREKENKSFQEQVTDQRAMQNILKKAVARLEAVFKKKAALTQQRQQDEPEAPQKKAARKQHGGGATVVALIEEIITDSQKAEQDAVNSEQEAQKVYETFVVNTNLAVKKLGEAIVSLEGEKSASEVDKSEAEADEKTTQGQLQDLDDYATDLHEQCDFVLKNFDIRQQARLQEIEALGNAEAILSGMKG